MPTRAFGQTIMDKITNVSAVGAVLSPAWLPGLESVSQTAALWAPILGCSWLLFQFGRAFHGILKRKPNDERI